MKKIILPALLAFCSLGSQAQYINAKPADFADMFKKTLIVEIADTNMRPKQGAKSFPQKDIGVLLRKGVEDLWKINAKIEYLDPDQVSRNLDKVDTRAVYLFLTRHPDAPKGNDIWVLNYSRSASVKAGKPDYQIYLPTLSLRKISEWNQYDINFILSLMQENLKHNQKTGSKLTAAEYMYFEAATHCRDAVSRNIQMDASILEKTLEEKEVRRSLKKINYTIADSRTIQNNIAENPDTCSLLIVYPRGFVTYSTSAFGEKYVVYQKVMVNMTNYRVMGAVGAGKKDNLLLEVSSDDLKGLAECNTKGTKKK
jgi:DNA-dependent RNA polymerase auxiliary subunit epsilon